MDSDKMKDEALDWYKEKLEQMFDISGDHAATSYIKDSMARHFQHLIAPMTYEAIEELLFIVGRMPD